MSSNSDEYSFTADLNLYKPFRPVKAGCDYTKQREIDLSGARVEYRVRKTGSADEIHPPLMTAEDLSGIIHKNNTRFDAITEKINELAEIKKEKVALMSREFEFDVGKVNFNKKAQEISELERKETDCRLKIETMRKALKDEFYKPVEKTITNLEGIPGYDDTAQVSGASISKDLGWQPDDTGSDKIKDLRKWMEGMEKCHGPMIFNWELAKEIIGDEPESSEKTELRCNGCAGYFATKGSLKRHHERKISCKKVCETNMGTPADDTPLTSIYEWTEQMIQKCISGEENSGKPYCKHCDVEFANKSNLTKHITKSVACNKLARALFTDMVVNQNVPAVEPVEEKIMPYSSIKEFAMTMSSRISSHM